jgi:N-acetylglucosamine-6-phosphate deacetylase
MIYEGLDCWTRAPLRVTVDRGLIAAVESLPAAPELADSSPSPDCLPYICPGFIDLQVNGYAGIDYSGAGLGALPAGGTGSTSGVRADAPEGAIEKVVRAIAASGTTRHLATIITGPRDRITTNCAAVAAAARKSNLVQTAVLGIHIEGPFISPVDGPRGAHDPKHVRNPDWNEFSAWQDAAEGLIRIVTVAPETEGALAFIEKVSAAGVVVAIGHTAASPERIREAITAGARLSTHLGNGSHAVLPRLKNYLWEQLGADELCASVIADGFHLPDAVMRSFARAKGLDRLVLVSDVAFLAGSAPGVRPWGDIAVEVHADGHLSLAGTEFLAGAGHLLDRDIARFMTATGTLLGEAAALCIRNPARLLGLSPGAATFVPGTPACITLFRHEPGAVQLDIETCVVGGEELYRRET